MRARALIVIVALAAVGAPLAAFGAPPAQAAVSVDAGRVLVSAPGVRVTITRSPFAMQFAGASGRVVLDEVPGAGVGPSVLAPTLDPVPPGVEPAASGQLYAPLAFLVGTQTVQQYEGLIWGGDLISGERSGVQYSARSVVAVRPAGSGARLVVSTDDPTGRRLVVDVAPIRPGVARVSVVPDPASGVAVVSDAFGSPTGEAFHGFGGRHNGLDQRGVALASFVEEENLPGPPGTAVPAGSPATVLFPNGPSAAYYPQAQFVSSHGYGFLLDVPQLAWFRMDSDRPDAWSVAATGASLSYLVAVGRAGRAIDELTALTGRQPAPPRWALGPMLDRLVKNFGETDADYEAELQSDLVNLRRYRIPVTAYRIEGWGLPGSGNDGLVLPTHVSFALQSRIVRELRARRIHPLAYLRPFITPGSAPDRAGLTVRTASGGTYETTTTSGTQIALLDFTNPRAVAWWSREVQKVLGLGFDGFMADFGEEVTSDMRFANGETGATMHNRYPILYMQATRAAVRAFERSHRRRSIWFFNRAGYSGVPGSAAFEGGNFPGDESTDWGQAAGLASLAPDMLNRAVGGAFGYGTDIGGYYDYTTPPTSQELFLRWAEWAALSPVFRLHGSGRSGTHTPWSYGGQVVRVYRWLSRLHEAAAGLILRLWHTGDRNGMPPTRPLWLQFPGDPRAASEAQEWMLGADVLVAPVVAQGATSRIVYFPTGCWRDPQTGLRVRGRRSVVVPSPLTRLPFFFRCGKRPFRVPSGG